MHHIFGKLFIQITYAIVAFTIIIGVHVISGYLLLENSRAQEFEMLLRACLARLPLFFFGLAAANCFVFIIEGVGGAIAASCGLMIVIPWVSNLLGMKFDFFKKLSNILPMDILNSSSMDESGQVLQFYWTTEAGFRNCWMLGLIQMVIIFIIGYVVFRKKEIK